MALGTRRIISEQDFRETSSTQQVPLGELVETVDGKKYRYTENGGSALDPGKVTVAAADADNHLNRTVDAAVAVGATELTATLGATAAAENLYAEGTAVINDAAGEGIAYRIRNHAAVDSAGALTANLDEEVQVALTTSSQVSFIKNPWKDVVIAPGAIAHRATGVPNVAISADEFGFLQTGGDCAVLSDGVVSKGAEAILSDAVNGAVEIRVDATIVKAVGFAPEATVDTEYRLITLTID